MNWEQISSILRHILTFGGGFIVAKGWISADALPGIVGAMITIGGVIWGMFNKTESSIVASAAALPGTTVVTTPALAAAVTSPDAVSSAEVKVVAK
ncbi:hypothetical protein JQ574_22715 [Bradyrhizobium sp. AUGA SZCCT0158]|uniref:Pam3-gp28 family putative phage holin n=1 Tax=Bradyrhizobium sp. AUGA SZCCT0158 TaxID=2807661 RepID=UPI001BA4ECAE|nr:hypothetical protein [Bradyrhizobium sp. AUGA SZCCT0158]MBR1198813.1 hypothetical protein [Bradyrhizobium sp. AUGA SZCCT0158]